MISIQVNIDSDELMDSLAALAREGEDATPIMRGLAGVMRSSAEDALDMERDPVTGAKWPPLNEAYKRQRYADRYTGRMLNRTGRMRQSLSVRYGRDYAVVGVSVPYARTRPHVIRPRSAKALRFYGRTGGWVFRKLVRHPGGTIPARPFLGVGEDQKDEMRELIVRQLERAVRGK